MNKLILFLMILLTIITAPFLVRPTPIPRLIHYVWVGRNPLPNSAKVAIASWKKHAPGYRIIKWDETNCPIGASPFARKAYRNKNWAFVSDYCRFYALNEYGGIYMDTDQYLIRDIRPVFKNQINLIVFWGSPSHFVSGIMAGSKAHPVFAEITRLYETNEKMPLSPPLLTQTVKRYFSPPHPGYGYRIKNEVAFYPATVALINLGGPETIGVHGYDATWVKGAQGGEWRSVVYRDFMKHIAIKIIENQKTDYLIPYRHPYVYRLSDKKQGRIIRQLPDTVTVKYTDGLIRTYPLKR